MFRCGQYVRHAKEDLGTGQVVRIDTTEWLDGDKIRTAVIFGVKWVDLRPVTGGNYAGELLAPAARNVPRFESREEADAWMEAQRTGGSWVGAAEDFNATVANVIDASAAQLVTETEKSLRVQCGSAECGCQDCATIPTADGFEHCASNACGCVARDCGCAH